MALSTHAARRAAQGGGIGRGGLGGAAPAPSTGAPPRNRLTLPERTWVSRPLATGYGGPGLRPYGSRHMRLLYDSKRGRMVLTAGYYPNPHIPRNGNQMVWAPGSGLGSRPDLATDRALVQWAGAARPS